MTKIITIIVSVFTIGLIVFLVSSGDTAPAETPVMPSHDNYNITILLDLSDRISGKKNPDQHIRDAAVIRQVVSELKRHIHNKGIARTKDRIKVVFYPHVNDMKAAELAGALSFDFGAAKGSTRKKMFKEIDSIYGNNLTELYRMASNAGVFAGSDIFNFFKHRAADDCIAQGEGYKNILVLLTDGYMYNASSKRQERNRYSYIGPEAPHVKIFRNNPHWENVFREGDYGFIPAAKDLAGLHILAVEFAPAVNRPIDYDIMLKYWQKWFDEMNIPEKNRKFIKSDLPSLNAALVQNFFGGI